MVLLSDPFRGRKPNGSYSNQSDAYFSNTCLDFPVSTDVADYKALAATFRKVAPHFRAAAYNDLPCAFWSVPAERTPAPASGRRRPADRRGRVDRRPGDALSSGRGTSPRSSSRGR